MKINKLTILELNNNIAKCLCDCGNIKNIKYNLILSGKSKSCKQCPKSNLSNKTFNYLYVNNYDFNLKKWKCTCICNKVIYVLSKSLKNNNTKSCGCIRKPKVKNPNLYKKVFSRYSDGNLTIKDFLELSKLNCHYCNSVPNNNYKGFVYSGLDRINSNLPHNKKNIVPCCILCNRFKSNLSIDNFKLWINSINPKLYSNALSINLSSGQLYSLRKVWSCQYNKELSFNDFVNISQQNCYYCDLPPSNFVNNKKYKKINTNIINQAGVYYSTLDRIDNNLDHNIDNVIPACTHCNRSRNKLSINDFLNHISKIKNYFILNQK